MLTLITFSITHELDFTASHYRRTRDVANLTTAGIIASVVSLMFLSFPLGDPDVDRAWYQWVYYGVLLGGAITGGLFISAVLMLYYAVRELIGVGEDATGARLTNERRGCPDGHDSPARSLTPAHSPPPVGAAYSVVML